MAPRARPPVIARGIGSRITLNNAIEMPRLGLGVFRTRQGAETRNAVREALAAGYRLVDTAALYGNEREVGEAIRASGLPREEVFVTTKLWNSDHGYDPALRAFDESLAALGLDYVDLYLIHWPVPGLRFDSWRALETLLADGRCRAIGVSNYTIAHLTGLLEASDTLPAVNQVEFHPFLFQRELLDFCRAKGVQLEAYSPLAKAARLQDPQIDRIARRHARTPAQVLLRWSLQHDLVVIPKSARRERIRENADVFDFELDAADMRELDALDEGHRTAWDPTHAP